QLPLNKTRFGDSRGHQSIMVVTLRPSTRRGGARGAARHGGLPARPGSGNLTSDNPGTLYHEVPGLAFPQLLGQSRSRLDRVLATELNPAGAGGVDVGRVTAAHDVLQLLAGDGLHRGRGGQGLRRERLDGLHGLSPSTSGCLLNGKNCRTREGAAAPTDMV